MDTASYRDVWAHLKTLIVYRYYRYILNYLKLLITGIDMMRGSIASFSLHVSLAD